MADQPANLVNETILAQTRKHWINVAPIMVSTVVLALVWLGLVYSTGRYATTIRRYVPVADTGMVVFALGLLIAAIAVFSFWIYRQNRLVLTNHHLVEYTRRGLFNSTVSQFSLIKLQDVTARQNGLLANMLGYGDIVIETAGEQENFMFNQVPHPKVLADQIMKAHESLESMPSTREV